MVDIFDSPDKAEWKSSVQDSIVLSYLNAFEDNTQKTDSRIVRQYARFGANFGERLTKSLVRD